MDSYTLQIGNMTRELPIIAVNDTLSIASFVILGDTEIVSESAALLAEKLPEVDVLVTAEAKGIPFVHELSKQLGKPRYIVARKSVKAYMHDPFIREVTSITTQESQMICLDGADAQFLKGKRIALVDDVISTGESLRALEELVTQAGAKVVVKAAILAEGDAKDRSDILYLAHLPLFKKGK